MTQQTFSIRPTPRLRVLDSTETFPVGRVFCVGRNYEAHAKEMGQSTREPPFFFTKFADSVVPTGTRIQYPPGTANFHYEGELVLAIGREGHQVTAAQAEELIFGYAAGLDMTRRDLQLAARDKGRPWDLGKNFEQSAPVGDLCPRSRVGGRLERAMLELTVNGVSKQKADIADMIWNPLEIVAYLSAFYRLLPGDLIFTGTPAGVGPTVRGDTLQVTIEGLPTLTAVVE